MRRTPPAARGGVRPAHVPRSPLHQPRARARLAERDGNRALVVPRAVAQRAGHARALRRDHRARDPGAVAALRPADARMPLWEATQYALGLLLPALLISHVVGTRIAWWRFAPTTPMRACCRRSGCRRPRSALGRRSRSCSPGFMPVSGFTSGFASARGIRARCPGPRSDRPQPSRPDRGQSHRPRREAPGSGRQNAVVATVLPRGVHHPLHAIRIGAWGQLARGREHEA